MSRTRQTIKIATAQPGTPEYLAVRIDQMRGAAIHFWEALVDVKCGSWQPSFVTEEFCTQVFLDSVNKAAEYRKALNGQNHTVLRKLDEAVKEITGESIPEEKTETKT